ncbi:MAG: hypothetical protein HRT47_03150 [Candidatus Caenarcaniphilales bacterium]|nr:hypothetical protein [Candidatus Caenarcaniphilales bacterium]
MKKISKTSNFIHFAIKSNDSEMFNYIKDKYFDDPDSYGLYLNSAIEQASQKEGGLNPDVLSGAVELLDEESSNTLLWSLFLRLDKADEQFDNQYIVDILKEMKSQGKLDLENKRNIDLIREKAGEQGLSEISGILEDL